MIGWTGGQEQDRDLGRCRTPLSLGKLLGQLAGPPPESGKFLVTFAFAAAAHLASLALLTHAPLVVEALAPVALLPLSPLFLARPASGLSLGIAQFAVAIAQLLLCLDEIVVGADQIPRGRLKLAFLLLAWPR